MKKEKMSLFSCIFMGIGSIIGASIFSTTPIAAKIVGGDGVVLGFILASVFVFLKTMPEMVMISALPANGASYMHLTRLVHPAAGILHAFNQLVIGPMKIATMSLTFSTYFAMLFPQIPEVIVACAVTVIFTIISCYGIKASAWVQNISVLVLLVALGCYIFGGWGHTTVTLGEVLSTTYDITKLWAAMGIMHGSLIGANALMYAADEIENPGKNVPLSFFISTVATAVIYAAIAFVTVGIIRNPYELDNLATVAETFMGPGMRAFFISGGALLAVITSINAFILMFSRANFAAARDGLYPQGLVKINKHGVPVNSIWLNSIIAMLAMLTGYNLEDVINITSIPGLLLNPIVFFSVFMLPRRYPNAYKTSFLKIPHWVNCALVVVATVLSLVMGVSVLGQMSAKNYLLMVGFYIIALIYAILRDRYLKQKTGSGLFARMRMPYEPWMELEEAGIRHLGDKAIILETNKKK